MKRSPIFILLVIIVTILAVLYFATPSRAEGGYAPCDQQPYAGAWAHCQGVPAPTAGNTSATSTATAGAVAGAAAGAIGTGGRASVGNVSSAAQGGAGGRGGKGIGYGGRGGSAKARGGSARASGGNQRQGQRQSARTGDVRVDASNNSRYEEAANTVIAPGLNGYGPGNCFGDTNPSGSFSMGWGIIGAQATGARSKPSNICAATALMGPVGGIVYGAQQGDPAFRAAAIATGYVTTPSRVRAEEQRQKEEAKAFAASRAYTTCETRDGALFVKAKTGRSEEAVRQCRQDIAAPRQTAPQRAENIPTCPAGSRWDGRGCWMPKR